MALAVVLGARGSLGSALVDVLKSKGYEVIAISRGESSRARSIADHFYVVSTYSQTSEFVSLTDASCIFFAMGSFSPGPLRAVSQPQLLNDLSNTLMEPVLATHSLLSNTPELDDVRRDLVYIGSTSAYQGFAGTASYCAAKHGLRGFIASLNDEYQSSGTRFWLASMGTLDNSMGSKVGAPAHTLLDTTSIAEEIIRRVTRTNNFFEPEFTIRRRSLS